jgi:osmotically-inducible protein OsmY
MSTPPVDPAVAAGGPRPDSTDPEARNPPSRSADPGQGSYGGYRGEDTSAQPQPKGRDDDRLADALRERLRGFGDVDVGAVRIAVDDGRVTLSGEVADADARATVEARVAEVLGVSAVDNRLGTRGG